MEGFIVALLIGNILTLSVSCLIGYAAYCYIKPEERAEMGGYWQLWGEWSECPAMCGAEGSFSSRTRQCTLGQSCQGSSIESRECEAYPCPDNSAFTEWGDWTTCSATCGAGSQSRARSCTSPDDDCAGLAYDTDIKDCYEADCPDEGQWGLWSQWSLCSATCGAAGSVSTRSRGCGGQSCYGDSIEYKDCGSFPCPVDGGFAMWSAWTDCSVSCDSGTQSRGRTCTNPAPMFSGKDCSGETSESKMCFETNCPVNGQWNIWSQWSQCSATCGAAGSYSTRERSCQGQSCHGDPIEYKDCGSFPCPVDGGFTMWSAWSDCSVSCDSGTQSRGRTCTNPPPMFNGKNCLGQAAETRLCSQSACSGPAEEEILLIVGGRSSKGAEVISLSDKSITCGKSVPNLPAQRAYYGSYFKHKGDPVHCDYSSTLCYKYSSTTQKWTNFSPLLRRRAGSAIMEFDDYLLVVGGSYSSTSDLWNPEAERFEPGPDLPIGLMYPCVVVINSTHALMAGGLPKDSSVDTNRAFVFNREAGGSIKWTEVEPMKGRRRSHACALLSPTKVLVTGGYHNRMLDTAEVFDLETLTWSDFEPALPADGANTVQLEDTFLVIDACSTVTSGSCQPSRKIYEWNASNNNWQIWQQTLFVSRTWRPAVYRLPASYLDCE